MGAIQTSYWKGKPKGIGSISRDQSDFRIETRGTNERISKSIPPLEVESL